MTTTTTAPHTTQPEQASKGIVTAGYVFAVIMPIIGGIIGLVLMFKRRMGHGIAIMALAAIVFVIAFSALMNSAAKDTNRQIDQMNQQSQAYDQCLSQFEADGDQVAFDACTQ